MISRAFTQVIPVLGAKYLHNFSLKGPKNFVLSLANCFANSKMRSVCASLSKASMARSSEKSRTMVRIKGSASLTSISRVLKSKFTRAKVYRISESKYEATFSHSLKPPKGSKASILECSPVTNRIACLHIVKVKLGGLGIKHFKCVWVVCSANYVFIQYVLIVHIVEEKQIGQRTGFTLE